MTPIAVVADQESRRPSGTPGRLAFLDGLRGVAVGLVLVQHVGELTSPALRALTDHGVQLGQLGVMVFFLCSGFIIPASLEREVGHASRSRALAAFWRGRLFRLYPLYWLSLAGAWALASPGSPAGELGTVDWLVNVTMLQQFAGSPHALALYWTLSLELLFYGAVSVLFLLGRHRHSVALSLAGSAVCGLAAAVAGLLGVPVPLALFCLVTMFTGTVFQRWHQGLVGLRTLAACVLAAATAGTGLLVGTLADAAPGATGTRALVPMLTAWLGAYAVFSAGIALRGRRVPWALRRLGVLSYSVYLLQALVLAGVPRVAPGWLAAVVWTVAVLLAASLTHRAVELPAIRLGRRLAGRRTRLAAPAPERLLPHPATVAVPGVRVGAMAGGVPD